MEVLELKCNQKKQKQKKSLESLNSRFEKVEESVNLEIEQQKLCSTKKREEKE